MKRLPIREEIRRVKVVHLSVGPVKLVFFQPLGSKDDWWVEFETLESLKNLSENDLRTINNFGRRTAKKVRDAWE